MTQETCVITIIILLVQKVQSFMSYQDVNVKEIMN